MAVFVVLFDQNGEAVAIRRQNNPSVFAPLTDNYAVYSFVKAVVEKSASSFKGLSIDHGYAIFSIDSSKVLNDQQKRDALDVLAQFKPGDSIQFREYQKVFAIVTTGVPKIPPVIAVFVDP